MRQQFTVNVKKGHDARVAGLGCTDGGFILGNPVLGLDGDFDFDATNAFDIVTGGLLYTVAAGADFDTGAAKVIAIDMWAACLMSVATNGTGYLQWGADRATQAEAIEALDAIEPTGAVVVGYAVLQTANGVIWTAGTDSPELGAQGDVANVTNYGQVFGWVK